MNTALGALAAVGTALAWALSSIVFTLASLRAGARGWQAVLGTGVALASVAFMSLGNGGR